MSKYIDAEKLEDKIVGLRKELPDTIEHLNDEERGFARGQQYELTAIEDEILCLQQEQPEVDLEKEIEKQIRSTFYDLEGIAIMGTSKYASVEDMVYIARHFYELGLNARKED